MQIQIEREKERDTVKGSNGSGGFHGRESWRRMEDREME